MKHKYWNNPRYDIPQKVAPQEVPQEAAALPEALNPEQVEAELPGLSIHWSEDREAYRRLVRDPEFLRFRKMQGEYPTFGEQIEDGDADVVR